LTHNILTSLFRKSRKKPIWMPKTINEAAKAVTKATRLMPVAFCAAPGPSSVMLVPVVVAAAAAVEVVSLMGMDVACDVCRKLLNTKIILRLGIDIAGVRASVITVAAMGHACQQPSKHFWAFGGFRSPPRDVANGN